MNVKMKVSVIVFCALFFTAESAFPSHPLTTDDAGVVEIGKYELEVYYDNLKEESELRNYSCTLSLKQGFTEKMDVGVSFPYQIKPKLAEPFGPATLGLKFLLVKDLLALTVNNDLGSQEYFINGIFTWEVVYVTVHANVGYLVSGDETVPGEISYSFAAEYPFTKMDAVCEIIGEKKSITNWLLGIRYKLSGISSVSLAYGNGFVNRDEKITLGFHIEF